MIKLGVIGTSEGNGHPYSFSAIINGYSDQGMTTSGWPVIHEYLRKKDTSEFGFHDVQVTHAWTQDHEETKRLCQACLIPHALSDRTDMFDAVDGVLIARDDFETHYEMALPFLKKGIFVFVDKPLSVDLNELSMLKPYLDKGQLMSCSGMRYATELDDMRKVFASDPSFKFIRGTIVNSWEKYGVHLLDAIFGLTEVEPVSVTAFNTENSSLMIKLKSRQHLQIDCLGSKPVVLRLETIREDGIHTFDIRDNFTMFRRTLWHFLKMIKTGAPAIDPSTTLTIMKVLIAGRRSLEQKREVTLEEIRIPETTPDREG
ncbi:MAG: Gfo/Idh/MocA family oxidoreductase [Bacillota bacterium]|nr:Gfo/Idh/MocA family oxidoreductase [Bacillota bacterium]MDW7678843.1 Gfo/Idh/MocA family oxidoreductase [Bacillota bacterium]